MRHRLGFGLLDGLTHSTTQNGGTLVGFQSPGPPAFLAFHRSNTMKRLSPALASAILLAAFVEICPSVAQPISSAKPAASSANVVLIPGAMRGPGTMGPSGYRRLCSPLSVGLSEWRAQWVERLVKPTDAQKSLLNDLSAASTKAKETIAAACPRETVETTTVQLAVMERRVAGLLDALKIIRPAYDKFYESLDDQQKARLDALGPGRHGWRW